MGKKPTKNTRNNKPKPKQKPRPRSAARPVQPVQGTQGNQQPTAQPAQTIIPQAPSLPFAERVGGYAGGVASGIGSTIAHGAKGTLGRQLGEGFGGTLFGGNQTAKNAFGTIGAGGAIYGLGKLLNSAITSYGPSVMGEQKKSVDGTEAKYRKTTESKITQGYQKFDQRALDTFSSQQDEGWRMGLKSIDPENYKSLAVQAIKSKDPSALWNEVILAAKAKGKKVNTSTPVYLPQQFTKNGKQYGYAIDPSPTAEGGKPRLIPIALGKGVEWDEEKK